MDGVFTSEVRHVSIFEVKIFFKSPIMFFVVLPDNRNSEDDECLFEQK